MPTQSERKALLFFGLVISLGTISRVARVRSSPSAADAPAREGLASQLAAADSARHAKFRRKGGQKTPRHTPQLNARVDLDVAAEAEIEALRGVGPALAGRIVANRDSFGPFGSLEGLKRVRGVGSTLVAKLDSTVTFSLLPRPMNTVISGRLERSGEPSRHRPRSRWRDTLR
jgi:competence ComEA-like helix-hairpin-helix protein